MTDAPERIWAPPLLASLLEQMANQPSALDSYVIASASSMAITELRSLSAELARKDAALLAAEELADAMEWLGEWQAYDASSTSFPVKPPSPNGTTDEAKQRLLNALSAFRAAMEDTQ